MDADEKALLRTICDSPDDDTPRLVYADWLQEHGQEERAEFIRAQIERSQLDEYDSRYAELEAREKQLLKTHQREWIKPIPATALRLFGRGFVDSIQPRLEAWVRWGKKAIQQQPIQRAWFRREPYNSPIPIDLWTKFCNMPELANIPYLSWSFSPLTTEHVRILTETTHLTRLRGLDFHNVPLTTSEVRQILDWPSAASIRELNLSDIELIHDSAMADFGRFAELRELHMADSRFGDGHARMLALAPWNHLRYLYLGWNPLRHESIAAFSSGSWWTTLEELVLPYTPLQDRGVKELAQSSMPRLRKLTLWAVQMTANGAKELGRASWLSQLQYLGLSNNDLGDYGLECILNGLQGTELRELELRETGITALGFEALARCPGIAGVVAISVVQLPINEKAANALIESPFLRNVRTLNIASCPSTPSVVRLLQKRFGPALFGAKLR